MKNIFASVAVILAVIATAAPAIAQPQSQLRPNAQTAVTLPPSVDVDNYTVNITFIPEDRKIEAVADIKLRVLDKNSVSTFDLDKHFKVTKVSVGDSGPRFRQYEYDSNFEVDLSNAPTAADGSLVLHVEYYGLFDSADDRRGPVLNHLTGDSAYLLYEGKWFPLNGLYKGQGRHEPERQGPRGMECRFRSPIDWQRQFF
jgi:hypothetical protein